MSYKMLLWASLFFFCVIIRGGVSSSIVSVSDHVCHTCANGSDSLICRCDNMCGFYDDCCLDAPTASKHRSRKPVGLTCLQSGSVSFYAVDKCPSTWNRQAIVRIKCEDQVDFSDPLTYTPVIDTSTNVTYGNRYCAECNSVTPDALSSFPLRVKCEDLLIELNDTYGNITADFLSRNMIYSDHSWGVYHWDPNNNRMSFVPCWVLYELPTILLPQLRRCFPGAVSTCAPDWNDELTAERCISSGINIMYDIQGWSYRNLYCALCNNVQMNDTTCVPPEVSWGGGGYDGRASFTVLLDIKATNGNKFCPTNKIYDKCFKKCRALFCTGPDKVARNGECVEK